MDIYGRYFRLFVVFIADAVYQKSRFYGATRGQSVDESAEIIFLKTFFLKHIDT